MNGIDSDVWNSETDPLLSAEMRFNADSVQAGKAAAKETFQRRYGLEVSPEAPLFVCLGRLADQKGIDVLLAALTDLFEGPGTFSNQFHGLLALVAAA